MLRKIYFLSILLTCHVLYAQSDGCSNATLLVPQTTCSPSTQTYGTTIGATQTIPSGSCGGSATDDVWYRFTATSTSHTITVSPDAGMDAVIDLYSGSCSVLIHLSCADNNSSGGVETISYTNFTVGQEYRVRVYSWGSSPSASGGFNICVSQGPTIPLNNNCINAQILTVNSTCNYTNSTTYGATPSGIIGCTGNADDDVWFSFTATNSVQTITAQPRNGSLIDIVLNVYAGSCSSLSLLSCVDNSYMGQTESVQLVGLTPGQIYYIQLYDYYSNYGGDFRICITGAPTPAPSNDEPCNAIQLPPVTSECQYMQFTTIGATTTTSAPQPFSCAGALSDFSGGFASYSPKDVWFSITVPSTGNLAISHDPNILGGPGQISDGVMALYSGTCGNLTQIACAENYNYPGGAHDLQPMLNVNGLTPGTTVYLRYWGYGNEVGDFGFCVVTATNDDCANALYICDLNGYKGSTSAAYTPDRPGNYISGGGLPNAMFGNNESFAGVNQIDGTNTGGPFGYYPPSNIPGPYSSPMIDVNIENNSWIKFTASSSTVVLNVSVTDCFVGNYPAGGIQMQIFSSNGCDQFMPVSDFKESSTGFTITANGLTAGNDYLLMIDGYAGDYCNYSISANSGVQFPEIPEAAPICIGESVTLTAPSGATSYEWLHNGSTSQSVTVSPGTTQTYYCEVTGLCGKRQTLAVEVNVKPSPLIEFHPSSMAICPGESATITVTGANSYDWGTGLGSQQNNSTIVVSPTSTTTYSVTGEINGCEATRSITIVVNSNPTISGNANINPADCGGSNGSINGLSVSPSNSSISWTDLSGNVVSTALNPTGLPAGGYFINVTNSSQCSAQAGPFYITNPNAPAPPNISSSENFICEGGSVILQVNPVVPGAIYQWTGPNGFSSTNTFIQIDNFDENDVGNYCVTVTVNGCTSTASCENIQLHTPPPIVIDTELSDEFVCRRNGLSLYANGGESYTWTGPNSYSSTGDSLHIHPFGNANAGTYYVIGTDQNGCTNIDSINVQIIENPVISIESSSETNTFCEFSTAVLTVTGANEYSWTTPDGLNLTGEEITIDPLESHQIGWYHVIAEDEFGCRTEDSIKIGLSFAYLEIDVKDSVICPGDPIYLSASADEGSYWWEGPLGEGISTTSELVVHYTTPEHSGWYYVTFIDSANCSATDSVYIDIEATIDCLIFPDLISPNGDNMNDTWNIPGLEFFPNTSVEIYNRWGNLIYETEDYQNDWGGEVNKGAKIDGSGKVPVGTYFYILKISDVNNTPPIKGYIEVQY